MRFDWWNGRLWLSPCFGQRDTRSERAIGYHSGGLGDITRLVCGGSSDDMCRDIIGLPYCRCSQRISSSCARVRALDLCLVVSGLSSIGRRRCMIPTIAPRNSNVLDPCASGMLGSRGAGVTLGCGSRLASHYSDIAWIAFESQMHDPLSSEGVVSMQFV